MVAVGLGAVELLASRSVLRGNGFYSWDIWPGHPWVLRGRLGKPADTLFNPSGMTIVFAAQADRSSTSDRPGRPRGAGIGVALFGNLLLHVRNTYGLDGSDQMQTIVLSALLLYHVAPYGAGRVIALGFIAAQSMLSYFSAGYAKLTSPMWRDGTAISGVLDTLSYGSSRATRVASPLASHGQSTMLVDAGV